MPQITLEYTNNIKDKINFAALFDELHHFINKIADVNIDNCKSRAIKIDDYYISTGGDKKAFVSLDLYLLQGRSLEIKQKLGKAVLELLQRYYSHAIQSWDIQITVRVEDILRDTYFKYPAGTFTSMSK